MLTVSTAAVLAYHSRRFMHMNNVDLPSMWPAEPRSSRHFCRHPTRHLTPTPLSLSRSNDGGVGVRFGICVELRPRTNNCSHFSHYIPDADDYRGDKSGCLATGRLPVRSPKCGGVPEQDTTQR